MNWWLGTRSPDSQTVAGFIVALLKAMVSLELHMQGLARKGSLFLFPFSVLRFRWIPNSVTGNFASVCRRVGQF